MLLHTQEPGAVYLAFQGEGEPPHKLSIDLSEYFERLLESRGIDYWQLAFSEEGVPEILFEAGPKLFPDLKLARFGAPGK